MKSRTILISSIVLLMIGCRTRKVAKINQKELKNIEYSQHYKTVAEESIKDVLTEKIVDSQIVKKNDQKTSFEIRGKAEEKNPLSFYNVVNGDTIDLFKVIGTADVIFKSNKSILDQSDIKKSEKGQNESRNSKKDSEGFASGVAKAAIEIQKKTVDVVQKDFTIGTYLTFFFWGIAAIVVCGVILWIRKTNLFSRLINKTKKYYEAVRNK